MDEVWLIGRILFGLIFVASGVGHLTDRAGSTQYAQSKGVPSAEAGVVVSGLAFVLGGLSVILGVWADLGALVLVITLIPVTAMMHRFWEESDPQAQQVEMAMFMKNVSLIGGNLVLFSFVGRDGADLPYSITDGLFGI